MGAVRYSIDYKNLTRNSTDYRVEFFDDAGSGLPVGTFDISGGQGSVFIEEGPDRDPDPGVYPTSCEIEFVISTVQHQQMIDDLFSEDRDRFAVKVYRDGVQVFVGRLSAHDFRVENISNPKSIRLTAHCGLADLRGIEYESGPGVPYAGRSTFLTIIQRCFDALDIQSFYNGDFIAFTVDWIHADFPDTTTNPLEYTRVDNKVYRSGEEDTISCFDVLQKIATDWGAQLYYADNIFHFVQLSERTDANYERYVYDRTFTETASSGIYSNEKTIASASGTSTAAGGFFRTIDNLKEVDVVLEVKSDNLINQGEVWSHADQTSKDIGSVYVRDSFTRLRIRGQFESLTELVGSFSSVHEIKLHRYHWQIRVVFGSNAASLDQDITFTDNGANFWNPRLIPADALVGNFDASDTLDQTGNVWQFEDLGGGVFEPVNDRFHEIDIVTYPLVQATNLTAGNTYNVAIQVQLNSIKDTTLTDISADGDYSFSWWFRQPSLEEVNTGDDSSSPNTTTLKTHHIATNSVDAERKKTIEATVGDAPNSTNGIQIYDGTDWNYSSGGWRRKSDALITSKRFSRMLAYEILRVRKFPKEVYSGGLITHEYSRNARFFMFGKYWVPVRGSWNTAYDLFDGDLLEIEEDVIDDVTDTDVDVDISNPDDAPFEPYNGPDWPPGFIPFVPSDDLVVNEPLDTVTVYTEIDIYNPAGLTFNIGDYVQLYHPTTGESEIVQLTEAVDGSTNQTVSIVSHTFSSAFPIGSPIQLAEVKKFEYVWETFTANGSDAFVDVTGPLSQYDHDNWTEVYVAPGRFFYNATPGFDEFNVSSTTRIEFSFTPPSGQKIRIRYKRPKT